MQALKSQLEAVTTTLSNLTRTDHALDDAKGLKSLVYVIDRILDLLDNESCTLQQLKLSTLRQLDTRIASIRPQLEQAEKKFMIKYGAPEREVAQKPKPIQINFAGLTFACPLYTDREEIPLLEYGAVMVRSQPVIIYRYSQENYVSVTPCHVVEPNGHFTGDNIHTICCGNGPTCEYGANCRYFHDPAEWPDSQHIQKFQKSSLVKKYPTFGHAPTVVEQAQQLSFENLRTLARYCAVQMLLIHIIAARQGKLA